MNDFSYKLFKDTFYCTRSDMPVLLGSDGVSGPWHKSSVLPGCSDSAYNIVLRALACEPRADDPRVLVEDGADRDEWMLQYLGIRDEEFAHAELLMKVAHKIKDRKAQT